MNFAQFAIWLLAGLLSLGRMHSAAQPGKSYVRKAPRNAQVRIHALVSLQLSKTRGSRRWKSGGKVVALSQWLSSDQGLIKVISDPDGADLYVDESFIGNCPAILKLPPGKHRVRVQRLGYKDWSREIDLGAGSRFRLWATLEK